MATKSYLKSLLLVSIFISLLGAAQAKDSPQEKLFKDAQKDQKSQKWEDSLTKFNEVIAFDSNTPLAHKACIEIGKYHKYHRDWEKAIGYYREVVALAPNSREAHDAKTAEAAIYYFRQDFTNALAIFKEVLAETNDWDQIKFCSYWIKAIQRKSSLDQAQQFSCGKESLKIAFNILGVTLSDNELNSLFKDKPTMLSLLELDNAAANKGFKSRIVKVQASDVQNLDTPFIALVSPEHYVVVTKTENSRVTFIDPVRKDKTISRKLDEFLNDFQGYAMVFLKDSRLAKAGSPITHEEAGSIKGGVCWCCSPGDLGVNPNTEYDGECACKVGMPGWLVNTSNLNFIVQDIDLSYSSRGMPITFKRTYNSDDPREGIFGRSWTFNYNITLTENPDQSIDIRRGDGKLDHFFWNGTRYQGPDTVFDTLVKNADLTYTLTLSPSKIVYNFNSQGVLINLKDRNLNTISFSYDAQGKLTTITDPNGKNTTLTYSANNKVSSLTLSDGRVATFVYDVNNNLIQATDMVGATSSFTYDTASYITGITTPHQGTTIIQYTTTSEGRGVSVITDAQGNKRSFGTYQSHSRVRVIDSRGNATLYLNTGESYSASITSASGNKVSFEYDASGNRTKIKDSEGTTTTITYNSTGLPLTITDPLNNQAKFTYDTADNLISATDPKGNISTFTYDAKSNLISAKDADNGVTGLTYNSFGQLTRLTDAKGQRTDFEYDAAGNLTKMTDALGKITAYQTDTLGRFTQLTDPKAQVFKYAYDGVDHLRQITNPDSTLTTLTYNCCNLISVGTLQFSYDSLGRLTTYTNQDNKVITYEYDTEDNLTTLTYPDGKVVNYAYDEDNRLIKVTDWLGNVTEYKYNLRGDLTTSISPGLLSIYKYDTVGRLTKLVNYNRNTLAVSSGFEFGMDKNSNRTNIKRYLPLVGAVFPTISASYAYNSDNQLITGAGQSFSYDANGNTTQITGSSPARSFTYNYYDELTQYTSGTTTLNFQYDVLGNRIKKTGVTTTKYIVDPNQGLPSVIAETDVNGNITAYYVYGLGLISKIEGNSAYYYQYDGLGSTVAITDTTGAVKNKYAYDDFGNVATNSSETISNPFKYVGGAGVMMDLPDLLFMRARYYLPSVGRFINKDPIGLAGGLNLYNYVGGNPIGNIDPKGLSSGPYPPGWTNEWSWLPGSRGGSGWHWWDPQGGEWRPHYGDRYHPDHWDYNPWRRWNDEWQNIPAESPFKPLPKIPWWMPFIDPILIIFNPCMSDPSLPGCNGGGQC